MTGTIKRYDEDSYLQTFEATVVACNVCTDESGGKSLAVILDNTCFFPEGGGQKSDRGVIRSGEVGVVLSVTDVQIRDNVIVHYATVPGAGEDAVLEALAGSAFFEGARVSGEIDFARRFDYMQQHTGEHIVSGIICATFSCNNVGFRLADDHVTMDYDDLLTPDQIPEIEERANEAIWKNLPVRVSFPTKPEQASLVYRSKLKEPAEDLRIVEIPGVDVCACCAPHVSRTGEIGLIKITRLQNWKGGVRLSIVCGLRALRLFSSEHDMVTGLAKALSTGAENIPARFDKMKNDLGSLKKELKDLKKQYGVAVPGAERPSRA